MQGVMNKRKRILLQDPIEPASSPPSSSNQSQINLTSLSSSRLKRRTSIGINTDQRADLECGRLITVDDNKGERALVLQLGRTFTIGRDKSSDYITTRPAASQKHCCLNALTADTKEILVCLEDTSLNGTMWNGRRIHKETILLSEGDIVEIAGQIFKYRHGSPPGILESQSQRGEGERREQEKVGHYLVLSALLGTGSYAVVRLALNTRTLKQVACKRMRRKKMSDTSLANVQREVEILKSLQHPNINRVEEIVISEERVYVFLQLVSGGDLFSYLVKNTTLKPPEAKFIIFQLFSALNYLHLNGFTHRDGRGPYPKALLGDFGHSDIAGPDTSIRGTLVYNPPEVLKASSRHIGYDSRPVDCWSLGIVLYLLLFGYHPFDSSLQIFSPSFSSSEINFDSDIGIDMSILGETAQEDLKDEKTDMITCWKVVRGIFEIPRERIGSGDREVRELIKLLLHPNPKQRCTASKALQSRWILQSENELLKLYKSIVLKIMD